METVGEREEEREMVGEMDTVEVRVGGMEEMTALRVAQLVGVMEGEGETEEEAEALGMVEGVMEVVEDREGGRVVAMADRDMLSVTLLQLPEGDREGEEDRDGVRLGCAPVGVAMEGEGSGDAVRETLGVEDALAEAEGEPDRVRNALGVLPEGEGAPEGVGRVPVLEGSVVRDREGTSEGDFSPDWVRDTLMVLERVMEEVVLLLNVVVREARREGEVVLVKGRVVAIAVMVRVPGRFEALPLPPPPPPPEAV